MNRRKFLRGLLIVPVAPAIVKVDNIMKITVPAEPSIASIIEEYGTTVESEGGWILPSELAERIKRSVYSNMVIVRPTPRCEEYNKLLRIVNHE